MANKATSIPANMTIEAATIFWDSHSVADYPSHTIEMEYAPEERKVIIPIEDELIAELKERADEDGISIEALVNLWIREKLAG